MSPSSGWVLRAPAGRGAPEPSGSWEILGPPRDLGEQGMWVGPAGVLRWGGETISSAGVTVWDTADGNNPVSHKVAVETQPTLFKSQPTDVGYLMIASISLALTLCGATSALQCLSVNVVEAALPSDPH